MEWILWARAVPLHQRKHPVESCRLCREQLQLSIRINRQSAHKSAIYACANTHAMPRDYVIRARRSKMADVNRTTCSASASSRLCPHCDRWLSRTAFNEHRALYFHKDTSSWKREAQVRWLLRKQQLLSSYLANHGQDM